MDRPGGTVLVMGKLVGAVPAIERQVVMVRRQTPMAPDNTPDWSRIPQALAFIIEPAKRYGHIQFEEQVEEFEATASDDEKAELKQLAHRLWEERGCEDGHAVVAWVRQEDITKHAEAARVEWLMVLLNKLGYC